MMNRKTKQIQSIIEKLEKITGRKVILKESDHGGTELSKENILIEFKEEVNKLINIVMENFDGFDSDESPSLLIKVIPDYDGEKLTFETSYRYY